TIDLRTNKMTNYKKWNSYAVDLSSLINPEPGAIYRVEFTIKKAYSLYSCDASEVPQGEQDATGPQESESDSEDFDEWEDYDYYDYYYNWRERENPCSHSYFSNNKIATNVLATNLGVIAKRGDNNTYFFAVNDITTTEPVSGATIELFSYQSQKLADIRTESDGTAILTLDKKAYF